MKFKLLEYNEKDVAVANKTSRSAGASALNSDGTIRSIVARYILKNFDKNSSILDFGAGKDAVQANTLKSNGFKNVTAYDFGSNSKEGVHDPNALSRSYDIVFASNVLNVSSNEEMLRETIQDIWKVTNKTCVFNYPMSPRKWGVPADEVKKIITDITGIEPTLVGGTNSMPLWRIDK